MVIPTKIFRTYDIRGIFEEDLTEEVVAVIGRAIGTYFINQNLKRIIVGHDNRVSSPKIKDILIKNLLETGVDVVDLDTALTPFVYFSWHELDANATIMITASHNPVKYNGFKISRNKKPLVGEDYQEIMGICQKGQFAKGEGHLTQVNLWPAYKEAIKKAIRITRPLKVAVDCGNGTASLFAPEILRELGNEVATIFCESDGRFPHHDPYPQKIELYEELIKTLKAKNASLGLAFDGDADRLGVYDEKGNFVENDRLAMIFAEDICRKHPHPKIVMNVSTSLSVIEYIQKCGGEVILWKTGYPFIAEKMNEVGAIFGGEISGHFFFKDRYFGYDDALYAACRILEIVSLSQEPLSAIVARLPRYYETREMRIELSEDQDKFAIARKVATEIETEFPESQMLDIDGLKFIFADGWGLIRPSNTEPIISVRAEAKTPERLTEIKQLIQRKLEENSVSFSWE
ncbi:MAG TPA: phosphomannomutase/phosphoglucomutase [Patescibacteria group bacterium]|nr:phosphomannomutase/phosphoglucomutase [Patescibacteria group bacterium]